MGSERDDAHIIFLKYRISNHGQRFWRADATSAADKACLNKSFSLFSQRPAALSVCLNMIFSKTRRPLFGLMLMPIVIAHSRRVGR